MWQTKISIPVKQIMEEAVTRKFVHEDSSHIISFCAVVEACVLHGLKRRAAGFLRSNKLAALFTKVGKIFTPAEDLCKKVQELEQIIENNSRQSQSQMSQDSIRKQPRAANLSPQAIKHLWIRTALTEKVLDKIVLYLVENSSKFYEREALLRDPVDGPILASLLVGPCALEYTKAKTANHFWTDPSADELVQRHRIHSGHCRQDSPTKRPALIQKRQSSGSMDDRPSLWARDYVESLHQNSRATLLFGKNNVLVQPTDDMEAIPGYLSLHQTAELMTLKWTPNQLMNGNMGEFDYEKSVYWDYAMTIRLEEIVYLHCHQQVDSGGTVVLVSQDGIQRPPFRFPKGGHLLQFLTCLETGLLPHGQLDPPLWSQRGKGKVFPKLRKRSPHGSCESFSDKDDDEATDYVFRIIYPGSQEFVTCNVRLYEKHNSLNGTVDGPSTSRASQGLCQSEPQHIQLANCYLLLSNSMSISVISFRAPLKLLCETMKYQIISRAFYGWLAYCRHLSTVRTHLSALVNPTIIEPDVPHDARVGLSAEVWKTFLQDSSAYEEAELLRLVYYGGVEPTLRKEVWPFLLGHYHFTMTLKERKEVDEQVRACYEQTMSEWLGCEAIVRQREKEQHAAALAKCASGASVDCSLRQDSTISSDVFGSVDEVDPIESEPKPKDEKPQPKIPNGTLPNCTSSPDSGHPSSRNFSVTSGLSDCSPSTEDASTQESGTKIPPPEPSAVASEVAVEPPANSSIDKLLDLYTLNLHRIDKDVQRCDRNYWYFTTANLEKLRNIMCSYVWQHLDIGYVQGMCDLLAPLLVILDDEAMAFSCFTELMKRMNQNFPHGGAMDTHFANMRSLIQILDSELFELMQQNGDYTHFYFCYRWFLLDFKREMVYDDVFSVWETIWAARTISSGHFVLFIALALVELYRDIILENNMDFTDIIKFFNEMAERHDVPKLVVMARDLVHKVQILIENK
uniref:Small G protein signaling modulator 1b n=1 Tax=Pygocentrus nattereri TaxID=42514 RepID=A0AAR2KM69_PYGNA